MAYILQIIGTIAHEIHQSEGDFFDRKTFKFLRRGTGSTDDRLCFNREDQMRHLNVIELFLLRNVFVLESHLTMHNLFTGFKSFRHLPAIHWEKARTAKEKGKEIASQRRNDFMMEMEDAVQTTPRVVATYP
jgi:hypothetical protein